MQFGTQRTSLPQQRNFSKFVNFAKFVNFHTNSKVYSPNKRP